MTTDAQPAEPTARILFIGTRLFLAADAFVFLAFLFAYVYLRALDTNGMWHPSGIDPSAALGGAVLVCMLVAAGAGISTARGGRQLGWLAVAAVVAAAVLTAVAVFDPGFSPSAGGAFGSVFIGFMATYLVHLLGAVYWAETAVVGGGPEQGEDLRAASAYVTFLAGVIAVAFVLLYLV